jgi:hypothetical protein
MTNKTDTRRYGHVIIVGLDGMGIFCKDTPTPRMDEIFANGAATTEALSLFPTISAQNWGAMLLGTEPEVHGLTNGKVSQYEYKNEEFPSIFKSVRRAYPNSVLCSISNWEPINKGIIEHDIDVEFQTAENGEATTEKVVECILSKKPDLLFTHIDDPDEAGHHFGYGTQGHLDCISNVDSMVGRIYDACVQSKIIEDTLFIVITDHGGFKHGHGGYTDTEKYIYFALTGKTVANNKGFFATTKDLNAVVRYAFGIEIPKPDMDAYSSQIPDGLFTDCDVPYILPEQGERNDILSKPQPELHSEKGLLNFFDEKDIKLAMFFEFGADDATGKAAFTEHGSVKYYSSGVRGANAELGATGCLVSEDVKFGCDDFTVCAWLNIDNAPASEAYYCATKTMTASGAGFALGFTNVAVWLGVETEDPASYEEFQLPYIREISGGWLHCAVVFRRKDCAIDLYWNFKLKRTFALPESFADASMDALPFTVGDDASHKINSSNDALIHMDDLLIFSKAFDNSDIKRLEEYYGYSE